MGQCTTENGPDLDVVALRALDSSPPPVTPFQFDRSVFVRSTNEVDQVLHDVGLHALVLKHPSFCSYQILDGAVLVPQVVSLVNLCEFCVSNTFWHVTTWSI